MTPKTISASCSAEGLNATMRAAESLPDTLRRTTEALANLASVNMTLWCEHSNAVLEAAAKLSAPTETAQQAARIASLEEKVTEMTNRYECANNCAERALGHHKEAQATIAQLTERLATAEDYRCRSVAKAVDLLTQKHTAELNEQRFRAETAESQLATALAQLKEAERNADAWAKSASAYHAEWKAAESALAAKTREMEEMREIISWLEQNDVMFTSGYLIATKETVFTVHDVREEGIDDACGDELGTGPTLHAAILAAMKAARSAPPAEQKAL